MNIKIVHLYPDLLNLYGDRGNIQCMVMRCRWRGIDAQVKEYRLGDGGVPFPEYLATLKYVGYDGFLTIEREAGATRFDDIRHGVELLRGILNTLY